ncbi:MAG: DUF1566 domain-containing protein [Epsilonproteobacteria bacterium]|nr:DUF1566 domain-containing protein [Campylobacterota bacterium]
MKKEIVGFLLVLGLSSILFAGDFIRDDTKEVVVDTRTNLMWQDDNDAATVTKRWEDAIDYCEALTLGGYSDWHLPNHNEILGLVDITRVGPAIDSTFQNFVNDEYWSSTTKPGSSSYAFVVDFYNGGDDWVSKTRDYYIRCVRDN